MATNSCPTSAKLTAPPPPAGPTAAGVTTLKPRPCLPPNNLSPLSLSLWFSGVTNMSVIPTNPTLSYPTARDPSRDSPTPPRVSVLGFRDSSTSNSMVVSRKLWRPIRAGGSFEELDDSPVSVELAPICSEAQFDRVVAEAQQLRQSFVVVWMASWCRKCIYLKPKLEKLAAEYYPSLMFYSIDVNSVPHKLVARAQVTKMPTVQLWNDGKKQAEVIGGHGKAYLVINEVCAMIETDDST